MQLLRIIFITAIASARDPEESMSTTEMIAYWKYPVESYDVITEDGYILTMLRIPHGRSSIANSSCHRPPILLVHGLMGDASMFVMNPPESSPGMILVDAGFDVFLINVRGTTTSQRHLHLSRDDGEFWKFSKDDMARFDMPAAIDKALEITREEALYLLGHSQGTAVTFMMLAERPEYNSKVRAMFELTPVATGHYSRSIGGLAKKLYEVAKGIVDFYVKHFGSHELPLFRIPGLLDVVKPIACLPLFEYGFCRGVFSLFAGPPTNTFNFSRVPVYLSHFFESTSTWTLLQYGQNAYRRGVYHFDVSPAENMKRYGQIDAPPYNYSNIDTDVYLFWSRNDWATTSDEIENYLIPQMRPGVIKGSFDIKGYNHLDFSVATDNAERVFSKIIAIVRGNETNSCTQ